MCVASKSSDTFFVLRFAENVWDWLRLPFESERWWAMAEHILEILNEIQLGDRLGLSAAGRLSPEYRDNVRVGPSTAPDRVTKRRVHRMVEW